ncbi:hypothetical protein [Halothiobacillus sp. DCM-1]|uniref:hypothetical protein n=1 Tax=Halothiobacillus sp. DCM-1 TaxID=3112558 RepID=UPI003249E37E
MSDQPLITPPGGLPDGAPKGLNDLLYHPLPDALAQAQQAITASWQQHALGWMGSLLGLALLLGLVIWLHRDWRGRLLRWQLTRLARLCTRRPQMLPEPIGAALGWALARYFRHPGGLDRRALRPDWQAAIRELDRLRFAAAPAPVDHWLALLHALRQLSRPTQPTEPPR